MIRLQQTFGAHAGRVLELDREPLRIGRLPTCDVVFDAHADIDASGLHCELRRENGAWFCVDAGSRNGTFVNGTRITRAQLTTGDVIECGLGGPRLRVELPGVPAPSAPPTRSTTPVPSTPGRPPGAQTLGVMMERIATTSARRSTRAWKLALAATGALLLIALGAIALLVWALLAGPEARTPSVQLPSALGALPDGAGERIAEKASHAVFLLSATPTGGARTALCSAFVVRPRLLATNAHCVLAMERGLAQGTRYEAIPNGGVGPALALGRMWRHPGYVEGSVDPTADVGVLEVAADFPHVLDLATLDDLGALSAGSDVFVYGFPAAGIDPAAPTASLTAGVVGRLTRLDGAPGTRTDAQLVQHSALTGAGTSGSPLFDRLGRVVAINTGAFRTTEQQVIVRPGGAPVTQEVLTESGARYGVRIDLLVALLEGLGQ